MKPGRSLSRYFIPAHIPINIRGTKTPSPTPMRIAPVTKQVSKRKIQSSERVSHQADPKILKNFNESTASRIRSSADLQRRSQSHTRRESTKQPCGAQKNNYLQIYLANENKLLALLQPALRPDIRASQLNWFKKPMRK